MKKTITQAFCAALFLGTLSFAGCGGAPATVEMPEQTAEAAAEAEKTQAEFSKAMQESYGKGN